MIISTTKTVLWSIPKKIAFRFFFIYLFLQMEPWTWLGRLWTEKHITKYYNKLMDGLVNWANRHVFHLKKVLVPLNGSGDTSYGWVQLWTFASLALLVCIVWSIIDRKRKNYSLLNYWLALFARYYVALVAFAYGIIKVFGLQMHFPHLYESSTLIGDFSQMHAFWMLMGYSPTYQAFAGATEIFAGLLLLYRGTTTLGAMIATTVFLNVLMLNLGYDIDAKIFSMQMVVTCLFLLANDRKRLICIFNQHKLIAACNSYRFNFKERWMRITKLMLKTLFIFFALVMPFFKFAQYAIYIADSNYTKGVIKDGVYNVTEYSLYKHNSTVTIADSLYWKDLILDNGVGSIKTSDTSFTQVYGRAYFYYVVDSSEHTILLKRKKTNLTMKYTLIDTNELKLMGKLGNDSLFVKLKRSKHRFQMAQRQFHWITEQER